MKKKVIIIISWILVVSWMGLIFYFSSMNGVESTNKSVKAIETTIKKTVEATNEVGITNKNVESKKVAEVAEKMNFPVRKVLHALEYFVLTLLLINALYQSGVRGNKIYVISFVISVLYALTDEYHQLFTERTSSLIDVLIDTLGVILSIILINIILRLKKKKI